MKHRRWEGSTYDEAPDLETEGAAGSRSARPEIDE